MILSDVIDDWRDVPFSWPHANCCHFAADVLRRVHGIEIDVPSVADADEARQWLHSQGHASLYHLLLAHFGKPVRPLQGHRADMAYRQDHDACVGVVDEGIYWLTDRGLRPFRRYTADWVFRVRRG